MIQEFSKGFPFYQPASNASPTNQNIPPPQQNTGHNPPVNNYNPPPNNYNNNPSPYKPQPYSPPSKNTNYRRY